MTENVSRVDFIFPETVAFPDGDFLGCDSQKNSDFSHARQVPAAASDKNIWKSVKTPRCDNHFFLIITILYLLLSSFFLNKNDTMCNMHYLTTYLELRYYI